MFKKGDRIKYIDHKKYPEDHGLQPGRTYLVIKDQYGSVVRYVCTLDPTNPCLHAWPSQYFKNIKSYFNYKKLIKICS